MTVTTETDKVILNIMIENQYVNSVKDDTKLYAVTDIDLPATS